MKKTILIFAILIVQVLLFSSFKSKTNSEKHSLTVEVNFLRNSKGHVQFSLYNKDGTVPDQYFKYHIKQINGKIIDESATVTFHNLEQGNYAVNILHDENKNGIIEKGWILPIEGVGFTNYSDIGIMNRPNFKKASFHLNKNTTKTVKVIYM